VRGGSAHARATKLLDLSTVRVQVRPLALASFRSKLTLFVIAVTRLQVNMSGGPNITDWVANMMVSLGLRGGKTFLRAAFARMREGAKRTNILFHLPTEFILAPLRIADIPPA